MSDIPDHHREDFENIGEVAVPASVNRGNFSGERLKFASQWLGELKRIRDAEVKSEKSKQREEELDVARSSRNAAWVAAFAAVIAALMAIIALAS